MVTGRPHPSEQGRGGGCYMIPRAFALFYTGTIGSGALSPVLYGVVGDFAGPAWGTASAAGAALLVCPLALLLAPRLRAL